MSIFGGGEVGLLGCLLRWYVVLWVLPIYTGIISNILLECKRVGCGTMVLNRCLGKIHTKNAWLFLIGANRLKDCLISIVCSRC